MSTESSVRPVLYTDLMIAAPHCLLERVPGRGPVSSCGADPLPLHYIAVDLEADMGAALVAEVEWLLACWAEFGRLYPDE